MLATIRLLSDSGPMRVELARWRDRFVVVKRLLGVNPILQRRLEREAEVVRRLEHPNIVPLLDVQDGALIYAYAPGVNLSEALERGPLPLHRSLKIAGDVLDALAYAHDHGVIHFDVKPANILVKGERAMLTDFGFAKDLTATAITAPHTMLGTPNFMAPEQFRGDRTDARSDLYAVGAVIYHMAAGEPPYGRQVLRFLAGDDRVPLDPLPPQAESLEPVVRRALERDPGARFPDARAMRAALEHCAVPAL